MPRASLARASAVREMGKDSLALRTACLPAILLAVAMPAGSLAMEYHVALNGRDSWSGSLAEPFPDGGDGPFATLERARDAIRALREGKAPPKGGVAVIIHGGDWYRSSPFELGARDSGAARSPVVYRAARGEDVRLSGGREITDWKPVLDEAVRSRLNGSARDRIVVSDLKAQGINDLGKTSRRGFGPGATADWAELIFNDEPRRVARYPNEGWLEIAGTPDAPSGQWAKVIAFSDGRPGRWAHPADLVAFGYWTFDWAESYEPVASLTATGSGYEMRPAEKWGEYGASVGRRFAFLNVLEELDSPGEYFVDRRNGLMYFYPPSPVGSGRAVLTMLEKPLIAATNLSHVTFEGFRIECGRGEGMRITDCTNVTVAGCTVRNMGTVGIVIEGGSGNRVLSCDVHSTGAGCITLSGGDRNTLEPSGHTVENCRLHHYGRINRTYHPAVRVGGVGQRVSHCLIHDAPHNAILFGGNDHVFEFNEVHRVCLETGDAGAFYMGRNPTERGTVIRHNYFHDIRPTVKDTGAYTEVMSVYLDDCACGTEIRGNLFVRAGRAIMLGGGRDNTIANNVFVDCEPAVHVDARARGWAAKHFTEEAQWGIRGKLAAVPYRKPPWSRRYPKLVDYLDDDPTEPKGNRIERNICAGGRFLDLLDGLDEKRAGAGRNWTTDDPGFVSPETGDYRLKPGAPALAGGFEQLPVDRMGLRKAGDVPH